QCEGVTRRQEKDVGPATDNRQPTTDNIVRSQCPYCGVGCGIELTVRDNAIVRVQGDPRHPANYGKLCVKGATLDRVLATPNRLTHAFLRHRPDPHLLETDLDLALRTVAGW